MTSAVQHAATAAQLRAEADLVELIAGVVFGAVSLLDAAESLRGVATAKRAAAERLDEMTTETAAGVGQPPADGAHDAVRLDDGGAPAAVPAPGDDGDGAAVTPGTQRGVR